MAHKKIRLSKKKQAWVDQFGREILRGKTLNVSVGIAARASDRIIKRIEDMERMTRKALEELFAGENYHGDYTADANIGKQAGVVLNKLSGQFDEMFNRIAKPVAETMVNQVDKNSAVTLKGSLMDVAGHMQFKTDVLTGELREMLSATVNMSVNLIKRVPAEYLDSISGSVLSAIQSGNGLQDIVPMLEKQGVKVRNWAKNVALDQTRKAYNGLNAGRMEALGMKKYEWVHSGGSDEPRMYHRDVLDGQIFSLDDDPVIDLKTGERGKPGQAINCRCTMRPVISFDD